MKPITLFLISLVVGVIMLSSSCRKKDDNNPQPATSDKAMIQNFFKSHAPAPQTFNLDISTGGSVTTADGTIITLPPLSLKNTNGNTVTGMVKIQVTEINSPSEMVFSDKPTVTANGEFLESAGEFKIEASQGNQVLFLADSARMAVFMPLAPNAAIREMKGWTGDTSYYTQVTGVNYQNTTVTFPSPIAYNPGMLWSSGIGPQVSILPSGYTMLLDSLGSWVNCDAIIGNSAPKTTIMGYFDVYNDSTQQTYGGVTPSILFFKPDNQNAIIKLYNVIVNSPVQFSGFYSYQNSFPIGIVGKFLAITTKNGKFYAQLKSNFTVPAPTGSNNYVPINFNLTEVSESQLLSLIQSL